MNLNFNSPCEFPTQFIMQIKYLSTTTIVLVLVIQNTFQAPETYSFQNTQIEVDMSDFSKDVFSDWTPADFESFREDVILQEQLVKEYVLEDMFPSIAPNTCNDEQCQTYMYDVTNHNLGEQHVKSQPTFLLIGGIHGSETVGTQGLMRFVLLVQKLYQQSSDIFQMLNNTRLLIVPMINMNGFYKDSDYEVVVQKNKEKRVDPNFDFNINPKEQCFVSTVAQFLQKLHTEFLVFGSLVFSKGDHKIIYPRVHEILGVSDISEEDVFYNTLVNHVAKVFNDGTAITYDNLFEDQEGEIPTLEVSENTVIKREYGEIITGAYIDWAAGASQEASSVRVDCLPPKSPFNHLSIAPTDLSNRAIAIEVKFNKDKLRSVHNAFGNEIACVDKHHPDAVYGIVAGVMNLTKKFVQSLVPYVSLTAVEITTTDQDGDITQNIDFTFKLYGSYIQTYAKFEHEGIHSQSATIGIQNGTLFFSKELVIKSVFKNKKILKANENYDLKFNLNLENQYMSKIQKNLTVSSHYLKVLMNPQYTYNLKKFSLRYFDSRSFSLMNFQMDQLASSLIYEKFNTYSRFFQERSLLVQMGPYFPFELNYHPESGKVNYVKLETNIPVYKEGSDFEDLKYQTGITNSVRQGIGNRKFIKKFSLLKGQVEDLEMLVYNDENTLFCKSVETEGFKKMIKQKQYDEEHDIEDDKQRDAKALNYEHIFESCEQYYTENGQDLIIKSLFMDLNQKVHVIPSVFMNLIGHKVYMSFSSNAGTKPKSKLLDNGTDAKSQIKLMGSIIIPDPNITGTSGSENSTDTLNELPPPEKVLAMQYINYLPFPKHKVTCGSVSPSFPIDTASLKESAVSRFKSKRENEDFFYVLIQDMFEEADFVQISVLTNAKNPTSEYVLKNKSQSFSLQKTKYNDFMIIEEEENKNKLKIYRGSFPKKDVRLEGLYVMVFKKDGVEPVFDCFLGASFNYTSMDAVNSFKVYLSLLREMEEQVEQEFGEDALNPNRKPRRMLIPVLIVFLILVIGGFGAYYYFFVLLKIKGEETKTDAESNNEDAVVVEE